MSVFFSPRAGAVTDGDGEPMQNPSARLSLAVRLEQGEMNQAVTSISSNNQMEHISDNFSTDGIKKWLSRGPRPGEKSLSFLSAR